MYKSGAGFFLKRNNKIILIILLHLLITVPLAYSLNTWYDEACSLLATSGSISRTIERSINYEWQPPVYYLLLNQWRKLDDSYFFARLLSIIFSCASIFVSYRFIKKYLNIKTPEFPTFLIAINPFLVYYATEIRLYTMLVFLSSVLIFLMYEIYLFDNKSKLYRTLFIFLSVISLHAQYYMGFMLVAIGVSIFIYRGWNKFKVYLIDMIFPLITLIGVIPFLGAISNQVEFREAFSANLIGIIEFFKVRIVSYLFAIDYYSLIKLSRYEIWIFLFLITSIFLFSIKDRFKEFLQIVNFKKYTTLPIVIVLLLLFIPTLIKMGRGGLEIRHSVALFLPLAFTATSLIYLSQKKKFLMFWFLLFSFLYITTLVNRFAPMAKEGDAIRISRYLESHEKENELIFVPYKIIGYPLAVHYKGKNSIVTLFDELSTEEGQKKLLKEINTKSGYFWWDFPYPKPTWNNVPEEIKMVAKKFINDNFTVLDKKYFEGMQLWYLKTKK